MASANGFHIFGLGLVAFALLVNVPAAHASIIDVNSGTTDPGAFNTENGGPDGSNVAIAASPSWAPAGTGYEWVSYANTGCNTFVVLTGMCTPGPANPPAVIGNITLIGDGGIPATPTAVFEDVFALPGGSDYSGTLNVWADDTARVSLNGVMLIDANPTLGGNCAGGPVGCVPGMNYSIDLATLGLLTSGNNTLVIEAYQLGGGSPFGVMYNAAIDAEPSAGTPEPASYVLMGLGLLGMGILIPRARRA